MLLRSFLLTLFFNAKAGTVISLVQFGKCSPCYSAYSLLFSILIPRQEQLFHWCSLAGVILVIPLVLFYSFFFFFFFYSKAGTVISLM